MMDFGFAPVVAITVICYLIGMVTKALPVNDKWIPVIAGTFGAALGVVAMYTMPGYPAEEPLTAIAIGGVSGLASTGANQVYKQITRKEIDNNGR